MVDRALSTGLEETRPPTEAALFLRANNLPLDLSTKCPQPQRDNLADVLARSCSSLVARSIGIPAAISSVSSSCSDGSSSDAYRHSTAYGRTTINSTTIDRTVMNASATNANASSIGEGVS